MTPATGNTKPQQLQPDAELLARYTHKIISAVQFRLGMNEVVCSGHEQKRST
jgi:hypothetical protein